MGSKRVGITVCILLLATAAAIALLPHPAVQTATAATPGPPGAPRGLHLGTGDGNVDLSWLPPHDDGGATVTGFQVHRGTDVEAFELYNRLENVTTFVDRHVTVGATHYYAVAAVNAEGVGQLSEVVPIVPTRPPGPPGELRAVVGNGTITLRWAVPDDLGGADEEPWYRVYRADGPGAPFVQVHGTKERVFADTGLENGRTYRYHAVTSTHVGASTPSEELSARPGTTPGPPVLGEPVEDGGTMVLAWDPPSDDGGYPIMAYKVYWDTDGDVADVWLVGTVDGSTRTFTDTVFLYGVRTFYWVTDENEVGEGEPSNLRHVLVKGPPSAPQNLRAEEDISAVVNLRWVPPLTDGGSPITEYRVYRARSEEGLGTGPTVIAGFDADHGLADRDIPFGVPLFYAVTASNEYGEGPMSQVVNITVNGPPGPPLNVTAGWEDGTVVVEWERPDSTGGLPLDGYLVARGVDGGVPEVVAEVGNVTRYEDTGVRRGTVYSYRVIAINTDWIGDASEMVWVQEPEAGPIWCRDLALLTIAAAVGLVTVWGLTRWKLGPPGAIGNG